MGRIGFGQHGPDATKFGVAAVAASGRGVTDAAGLAAALEEAGPGGLVLLEPGIYGALELDAAREAWAAFEGTVTIRSADPESPAVFTGLALNGVSNLAIENVVFDYDAAPGAAIWDKPFDIVDSSTIAIRDSVFAGDLATGLSPVDDGHGTGYGLHITGSEGVEISGSLFHDFNRAVVVYHSERLTFTGNEITAMRSDGLNFSAVSDVLIADNHIHDFRLADGSGDHADMIQFWTREGPNTDITIRSNMLMSGAGDATQSIFMRNEMVDSGQAGRAWYYENVTIEHNLIHNAHLHGITLGEAAWVRIANNTLLQNEATGDQGGVSEPTIRVAAASETVTVTKNVASGFDLPGTGWRVLDNLAVQRDDPGGAGYAGALYADPFADAAAELGDFAMLPGSVIATQGLGSALTHSAAETVPDPASDPVQGAMVSGPMVPDFGPAVDPVLQAAPENFVFEETFDAVPDRAEPMGDAAVAGGAAVFDGEGDAFVFALGEAFDAPDAVTFGLAFRGGEGPDGDAARVFWKHMEYGVEIDDGRISVRVGQESGGMKTVALGALGETADAWHRLAVSIDAAEDRLIVALDGEIRAERSDIAIALPEAGHKLVLGGVWGRDFAGEVGRVVLDDQAHEADMLLSDAQFF